MDTKKSSEVEDYGIRDLQSDRTDFSEQLDEKIPFWARGHLFIELETFDRTELK